MILSEWNANDTIALFTGLTFFVFLGQLWQMWRQNQHFRVTERGYVRMSHVSQGRDGLRELADGSQDVSVEMKNFGRTPARINSMWLTARVFRRGEETDFPIRETEAVQVQAFVMPKDVVFRTWAIRLTATQRAVIDAEDGILIIYGFVDYRDQFGDRFRGGYGRQFLPGVPGNNLGFPEVVARLNYDERRRRGVGLDWEQAH